MTSLYRFASSPSLPAGPPACRSPRATARAALQVSGSQVCLLFRLQHLPTYAVIRTLPGLTTRCVAATSASGAGRGLQPHHPFPMLGRVCPPERILAHRLGLPCPRLPKRRITCLSSDLSIRRNVAAPVGTAVVLEVGGPVDRSAEVRSRRLPVHIREVLRGFGAKRDGALAVRRTAGAINVPSARTGLKLRSGRFPGP